MKYLVYSSIFQIPKIRGNYFFTNKVDIASNHSYKNIILYPPYTEPKKIDKKYFIVAFSLLNINEKLMEFYQNGINVFLPIICINSYKIEDCFYEYKDIYKNHLLLPRTSSIYRNKNQLIIIAREERIEVDISQNNYKEKLYSKLALIENFKLHEHNENRLIKFSKYFKDINLRKKVTPEIVEKDLGKKYRELYVYFHNLQRKFLTMYQEIKNLEMEFGQLFSVFPGPVAILNKNMRINKANKAFKKIFGEIEKIEEIGKYEKNFENLEFKVFDNFDGRIKNGIIKIRTDKYYVLKFEILKINNDKQVIYFTDITENTMFEIVALIKLSFEEAENANATFEEFIQQIISFSKDLFNIRIQIKIKMEKEYKSYGVADLQNPTVVESNEKNIKVYLEFNDEFHDYDKKEIAKTLLKSCISKMDSEKIKRYNKKIQNDLKIAKLVQNSLVLEKENFLIPDYALYYQPSAIIGGDFATVGSRSDNFILAVGDVSGHGIASALMSIYINTVIKEIIRTSALKNLKQVAQYLKERLISVNLPEYMFAAIIYANLNLKTNTLEYLSAGFQFPLLLKRGKKIFELPTGGGIFSSAFNFDQEYNSLEILDNDLLLIFTDGLIELVNDTEEVVFFVKKLISNVGTTNPDIIIKILLDNLKKRYNISSFKDDVTILALRKKKNNYDIFEYKDKIYANLNTLNDKYTERFFKEVLENIKNKYNIDSKLENNLYFIFTELSKERLQEIKKATIVECKFKIEFSKLNGFLNIQISTCKDIDENTEKYGKIKTISENLPIENLQINEREISLTLKI